MSRGTTETEPRRSDPPRLCRLQPGIGVLGAVGRNAQLPLPCERLQPRVEPLPLRELGAHLCSGQSAFPSVERIPCAEPSHPLAHALSPLVVAQKGQLATRRSTLLLFRGAKVHQHATQCRHVCVAGRRRLIRRRQDELFERGKGRGGAPVGGSLGEGGGVRHKEQRVESEASPLARQERERARLPYPVPSVRRAAEHACAV
eukprot:scaffold249_cov132-Isochrysis_galbana.AAC.5